MTHNARTTRSVWVHRATRTPGGMVADEAELRRGLELLADPNAGCEVMALPSGARRTRPGGAIDQLVEAVRGAPAGIGVYLRLNPVPPGLDRPARNDDVLSRRWLFIDVDPVKADAEVDNPATDAEKEAARGCLEAIRSHLGAHGFPAPVVVDSGNGWYLLYRVDLPNDGHARALVKRFLHRLAGQFSGQAGIIDTKVHNANRLAKVPGTWSRKGTASDQRPHRPCHLAFVPAALEVVDASTIAAVAGVAEPQAPPPAPAVPASSFRMSAGSSGAAAYGRAALDNELARIATVRRGPAEGLNNALNAAAFSLGQLVAAGALDFDQVEDALHQAAARRGMDEREIRGILPRAIRDGMREPRVIPTRSAGQAGNRTGARANGKPGNGAARNQPGDDPDAPIILRASDVIPRKVEWLWPDRIPLGKLTTFAGVGGLGKTFVLCDIAARVSRGLDWPDSAGLCAEPGQVLFISGEDEPEDTLVPRLIELQADLTKVCFLRTEVLGRFTLADLDTLERALAQMGPGVRFVAIDPPTAYLGGVDDHKNSDVRALLTPLQMWAAKRRLAIVFNTHFTKPSGGKVEAMMRVMGSVAWVNAVRAAHMFSRDPEDPTRRLFVGMKNNLGVERKGLAYRIDSVPNDLARVTWLGEVDVTADEAANRQPRRRRQQLASEWLLERFREKRQWYSDDLFEAARHEGLSRNAVFEAKSELGLPKARRDALPDGSVRWTWWVPDDWPYLNAGSASAIVSGDETAI